MKNLEKNNREQVADSIYFGFVIFGALISRNSTYGRNYVLGEIMMLSLSAIGIAPGISAT